MRVDGDDAPCCASRTGGGAASAEDEQAAAEDDLFAGTSAQEKPRRQLTKAEEALLDLGDDEVLDTLERATASTKPSASQAEGGVSMSSASSAPAVEAIDDDLFAMIDDNAAGGNDKKVGDDFNFDAYINSQAQGSGGGGLFD